METTFLICAIVGGTLITCQFLMTLFGLGGHHDMAGGDHGDIAGHGGGDHHGGHADNSTWFLGMLTFRTVSAGLAFFGLVGLIGIRAQWDQQWDQPVTVLAAVAAGVGALFFVGWIMKLLARLNMDGTVRISRAVGCVGTVYLPIPAANAGPGKVHVSVMSRTMEYKAVTARDGLAVGAKVVVVAVIGSDTVEVAPAQE